MGVCYGQEDIAAEGEDFQLVAHSRGTFIDLWIGDKAGFAEWVVRHGCCCNLQSRKIRQCINRKTIFGFQKLCMEWTRYLYCKLTA